MNFQSDCALFQFLMVQLKDLCLNKPLNVSRMFQFLMVQLKELREYLKEKHGASFNS